MIRKELKLGMQVTHKLLKKEISIIIQCYQVGL